MRAKTTVAPGVEYLHGGTFLNPGSIFRVNDTFEPRLRYSPVALARMFEAAPAMLEALEAVNMHDDHEDCRFCAASEGGPHDPGATCSLIIAAIAEAHGEV